MSEISTQRRRKTSKALLLRSFQNNNNKNMGKRQKSCPSREYKQREREVCELLEQTSFSIDISVPSGSARWDDVSSSLNFFGYAISSSEETVTTAPSAVKLRGRKHEITPAYGVEDNAISEESSSNSESSELDESAKSSSELTVTPATTPTTSPQQQQQNTASTFIQIGADDMALVQLHPHTKWSQTNADLLYQPQAVLPPELSLVLQSINVRGLTSNAHRLLYRYHTESSKTLTVPILRALLLHLTDPAAIKSFMPDDLRYRSYCPFQFNPIFCQPSPDSIDIPTRKLVRIYLQQLRFSAHPLLLDEHRLSNTLEDLYAQYVQCLAADVCSKLRLQLQTERKVVNEMLKREAEAMTVGSNETPTMQKKRAHTLERQLIHVRVLRQQLYDEEIARKELLKQLLDTWLQLKTLRKTQSFQYTRCKLRIKVAAPAENAANSKRWTERFETDLNEIYREELESYYRAKRLWKAARREGGGVVELRQLKPKKPDIAQISAVLRSQLESCLGVPGEPQIEVQLTRLSDEKFYTAMDSGQKRLQSFFLKIYFDEELVGATRSYRLEPDLRLCLNEVFGIVLERRLPQKMRFALYEKFKLHAARKVSDVRVEMTHALKVEDTPTKAFPKLQRVDFNSDRPPYCAGQLVMRFQCEEQNSGDKGLWFVPVSELKQPDTNVPRHRNISWPDSHNNNSDVEGEPATTELVRTCTFEEELLQFCTLDTLTHNSRFRLLRSRYLKNDAHTRDLRFVAALENELEFDGFEQEEPIIELGDWMDPIDLYKHEGKKYLKALYEAIRNQCARLSTTVASTDQLLVGDEPASWSTFFQALALFFSPRRALSATPAKPSAMASLSLNLDFCQQFRIVLNIVRATGIPIRIPSNTETESKSRSNDNSQMFITQIYKYSNVRPFIALSYKDKLCRSLTAEGSSPTWNEQLVLNVSGSLNDLRDDLKITLFDEVIENQVNDELSVRNIDIYQRIQTNWLGEYRFPLSVLLAQKKLEGAFELNTPRVLLGYKPATLEQLSAQSGVNIPIEQYPEIKETVRLWCYMSVEPQVALPQFSTSCLECAELKEVRRQLHEWCLQVLELRPQRFIEPLVCTAEGKRVCLTRLLEPIPLPVEESENALEFACRFVSQLNLLKTYDACAGFAGIWLNNQKVLETTWCAVKDLGVLLCNFVLSIGLPSWLVLGQASPYGESAFVLYRSEEHELLLIDPCTGKRYGIKDVFCPLNKVFLVVAQDNLYCNIQSETRVTMTNFNLHDTSCWLPAFSKRNPAPLGGVQRLNYKYMISNSIADLRRNIERKIMKKISTWRTMRKTIWNRAFQPRLQSILEDLEHISIFANGAYTEAKYTDQLAAEFPSFKIYGFTLNFPYTNLTSISDRIKSTGIHLNNDKRVEFCMATHIHIYPNNILSVWIFLISIIPTRFNPVT